MKKIPFTSLLYKLPHGEQAGKLRDLLWKEFGSKFEKTQLLSNVLDNIYKYRLEPWSVLV